MQGSLIGFIQNEATRYDSIVKSFGLGIDYCKRRPIYSPWGGTTPCTVFMYDPGGVLGLPTTLTVQPGGYNIIAYTTWSAFSTAASANVVSGRGDWILFPGGTTVTVDPTITDFIPNKSVPSGKNAQYPHLVGTYDASSLANATNPLKFNTKMCKVDYSAILWPATFLSYSSTAIVGSFITICNIYLYAPNQANQLTGVQLNFHGQNLSLDNFVSYGGLVLFPGAPYTLFSAFTLAALGATLTSSGTTCTLAGSGIAYLAQDVLNGATTMTVKGCNETAYNGTFIFTYVDANTVTYQAATTPSASPATGTSIYVSPLYTTVPDSMLYKNILINQCGFAYCAGFGATPSASGQAKLQNVLINNYRSLRVIDTVMHHGGHKNGAVRTTIPIVVPSSITSSGTTATVNSTGLGTLVSGGRTNWVISGATASVYNGTYTLTASGANAATYTFAGNGGVSASVVGSMYSTNGTSAVGTWVTLSTTAITSLTQSGGTATALTTNTGSLVNGSWVSIEGAAFSGKGSYNNVAQVFNVVTNTSFQYLTDPRTQATATGSPAWADAQSAGWVAAQGDPPHQNGYNHCWYLTDCGDDIKMWDHVITWDASNAKWTGGTYIVDGLTEIRNPMSAIMACSANDTSNLAWLNGAPATILNHNQFNSDDCNYTTAGFRGWGIFAQAKTPFTYRNALIVNQDNFGVSNREGIQFNQTGTLPCGAAISDNILGFTPNRTSNTGVTVSYNRNIVADPAGTVTTMNTLGSGNLAFTSTPSSFQTAYSSTQALNAHTTFRVATPELAGVTVGSTNLQTEQNVCDAMFQNPWIRWHRKFSNHVRQYVGR